MPKQVRLTPAFTEALGKMSSGRQRMAVDRLAAFVRNPADPELRLRELRCAPGYWLINSTRGDRIILRKEADDLYAAVDVGGHSLIDEWERLAEQSRLPREP